jgi:monovalent cation:H+ antiporter, CPA1 family
MHHYEVITFVVCLSALFAFINARFIRWPSTIGIMVLSLGCSGVIIALGHLFPVISSVITRTVSSIDFTQLLMKNMLGFLLFAGSMFIDYQSMRRQRLAIITLATAGVILSAIIVSCLLYGIFRLFGAEIPFIYCLLFAALISATDPVAILPILKNAGMPRTLELKIAGESLFNDGVAVVLFTSIMEIAQKGLSNMQWLDIVWLFLRNSGGGLLYGLLLGYLAYYMLRSINSYQVEVLLTIALVMSGYMLADRLHVSGPLAMVVAGIFIGNKGRADALSKVSADYLTKFWELVDELLNSVIFLLMGFEMLVIRFDSRLLCIGLASIAVVLFARWLSVLAPLYLLRHHTRYDRDTIRILTWGGLRGALSVALALSLPQEMYRDQFVAITYMIVVFSITVQGLTLGRVAKGMK